MTREDDLIQLIEALRSEMESMRGVLEAALRVNLDLEQQLSTLKRAVAAR